MSESATVKRVTLGTDCATVFWDLLEPSHVSSYDSRMRRWNPAEYPPRVGTEVDFEMRLAGRWTKGRSRFETFDPPHHIVLTQISPPSPFRFEVAWVLKPSDDGCEFEYRFTVTSPPGLGWLGRLLLRSATSHLDDEVPALATRYL